MIPFTLQDKVDPNALIIETDYYKWLLDQKVVDLHRIRTKIAYLESQGFVKGTDKITMEQLNFLKAVEDVYFHHEIKPLIENRRN